MSAIAGIYSRRGAPVDRRTLERLSGALEQKGPDGEGYAFTDRVGMVYRPFHTDRESRFTPQPLAADDGTLLSWDGRLDNREDLRQELADDLPPQPRSLDFVLAAYRRWGLDAFAHLIGDFALALWEPRRGQLSLAVDSMGLRALYHHQTEDFLFWSSSLRSLVEVLGLPLDLDEEFVADFITEPNPCDYTPLRCVRTVPGGHVLVAGRERIELKRYWMIDSQREIRHRRDEEYEEHFREVFDTAVACRLQTDAPVFAELSGGLDSSSIVCVGDRVLAEGRATAPELHTVSYVYDSSPASDERPYMRLVEEQRQRPGIHVRDEDHPILSPLPPGLKADLPSGQVSFHGRRTALAKAMRAQGARVVLRGEAGDQVLWGEVGKAPFTLADDLAQGHLLTLVRSCKTWSRLLRSPFLKVLWQGACWPLLPRSLQVRTFYQEPMSEWLDPGFVERLDLRGRLLGPPNFAGFRLPSDRRQYSLIHASTRLYALEMYAAEGHFEARYPFLDRRLVELAMAIPTDQKLRPGETRSILRRSLRGILPEGVRTRRTKGGPTQAFQRALVREWPWLSRVFDEPRVCDFGIADRETFANALHRARHGRVTSPFQLLRIISLELWLRSFETPVSTTNAQIQNAAG